MSGFGPRVAGVQLVIASVLMVATLPGRTQGLGLVTEPLLADMGLGRVTYASMNFWATVLGALLCFPAGWLIERLGLRWTTAGLVVLLGASTWGLSAASGGVAAVFLLLLATRAFGQSALSVCSIVTVGRWFPERAGLAMGVYSVLLSVWFAVAFGAVGYAVRVSGWRGAWFQVALVLFVFVLPVVLFALREPRKQLREVAEKGSEKSGERTEGGAGELQSSPRDHTLLQALRTPAFWLFAGSAAAFNLIASGLGLFNEAVLSERGFSQRTFHIFLGVTTLFSLGGQFACGWLTRKFQYQSITASALFLYAVSLVCLGYVRELWQLWMVSVLVGFAGGMIIVVFFSVWSDFFGQKHLGRIQGAAQMLTVLSSGIGPIIFAKSFETAGSYRPLLFALAGGTLVLCFLVRRVQSPAITDSDAVPMTA